VRRVEGRIQLNCESTFERVPIGGNLGLALELFDRGWEFVSESLERTEVEHGLRVVSDVYDLFREVDRRLLKETLHD
jgi:hypothetical protein